MADCNKLFRDFDKKIFLEKSKRESLLASVKNIREIIKRDFKSDGGNYKPRFRTQGSFEMDTIIIPINSGDYDIDEGVYFDVENEPAEKPSTFHNWIFDSVKNHTDKLPVDKNPCVRVIFSDGHHVDLTIYYQNKYESHPKLAHKTKGWIESDPIEFINWFESKMDSKNQLRRIVRYFKAWSDFKAGSMPSGLILTILAAQNIIFDDRDDISFLKTSIKINNWIDTFFVCQRPTTPLYEDLFSDYGATNKKYFKDSLNSLISIGNQSISEESLYQSCLKWQKIFGDRFSCASSKVSEDAKKIAKDLKEGNLGISSSGIIGSSVLNKVTNIKPTKFYGEDNK